jgi:hypothetical protein
MQELYKVDPNSAVEAINKLSMRELNLFLAVAAIIPKTSE